MTDEQLTDEERARLEWEMSDEPDAPDGPSAPTVAKLLRIHDRLKARVEELERERSVIVTAITGWVAHEQGPVDTLDTIAVMLRVFAGTRDLSERAPLLLREIVKGLGSVIEEVARVVRVAPPTAGLRVILPAVNIEQPRDLGEDGPDRSG